MRLDLDLDLRVEGELHAFVGELRCAGRSGPRGPAPGSRARAAGRPSAAGRGGRASRRLDAAGLRERDGVADARVPPADVVRVLVLEVLRVVHQHARTLGEREPRQPLRVDAGRPGAEVRLVVRDVRQRAALLLDAQADRRAAVRDGLGPDARRPERELLVGQVVEGQPRGHLRELDREERRRQVLRDPLLEAVDGRGGPPEVDLEPRLPERNEEAEALEVVEVEVGKHDVHRPAGQPRELEPEQADARCRRRGRPGVPSASSSWTQEVLPPNATVSGPGDASEPRHPHTVALMPLAAPRRRRRRRRSRRRGRAAGRR